MTKVADNIRKGLEQAIELAEGKADTNEYGIHVPAEIDVRAIRNRLNLSQEEFAGRFGFSVNTLRHWEHGQREPRGAARAYLTVIQREPEAVSKALQAG